MNGSKKYKFHDFVEMVDDMISGKAKSTKIKKLAKINEAVEFIDCDSITDDLGRCIGFLRNLSTDEELTNVVFSYEDVAKVCYVYAEFVDLVVSVCSDRRGLGWFENSKKEIFNKIKSLYSDIDSSFSGMYRSNDLANLAQFRYPVTTTDVTKKDTEKNDKIRGSQKEFIDNTIKNTVSFLNSIWSIMREIGNVISESGKNFYSSDFFTDVREVIGDQHTVGFSDSSRWSSSDSMFVATDDATKMLNQLWIKVMWPLIERIKEKGTGVSDDFYGIDGDDEDENLDGGDDSEEKGYSILDPSKDDKDGEKEESGEKDATEDVPPEESDGEERSSVDGKFDADSVASGLNEVIKILPKNSIRSIRDYNDGTFGSVNDCIDMIRNVLLYVDENI